MDRAARAFAPIAALLLLGCAGDEGAPLEGTLRVSLLALGDTGAHPLFGHTAFGQLAVGQSLAWEHARAPADRLLLLGDNFYDVGLLASELDSRIAANVVRPYCAFVALDGECSPRVAQACDRPPGARRPIPIDVLLGNHDWMSPGSAELERERVPCYVSNWHVAADPVETLELEGGLSLVLYDTERLHESGDYEALTTALRAARGPWRVVAGHAPLRQTTAGVALLTAILDAGVPVHVHLAGHEHNLQIGRVMEGQLPIQVVAGGGSESRPVKTPLIGPSRLDESIGFARIDRLDGAAGPTLEVRLFEASPVPLERWSRPRVWAHWSIAADGRVEEHRPAP